MGEVVSIDKRRGTSSDPGCLDTPPHTKGGLHGGAKFRDMDENLEIHSHQDSVERRGTELHAT